MEIKHADKLDSKIKKDEEKIESNRLRLDEQRMEIFHALGGTPQHINAVRGVDCQRNLKEKVHTALKYWIYTRRLEVQHHAASS